MTLRAIAAHLWELVRLEVALYRSLARWIARRPDVPAGDQPIGYARLAAPMIWLWIFGSATEVVVFEVVLRQIEATWAEAVRLPLLVVGIWGLLWMVGLLASLRVRPHLLGHDRLLLRSGARTWLEVPLDAIAGLHPAEHELPGIVRSLHQDGDIVLVGVSSRTNLELTLGAATALASSAGELTAGRVGLWVDDPREVVRLIGAVRTAAGR